MRPSQHVLFLVISVLRERVVLELASGTYLAALGVSGFHMALRIAFSDVLKRHAATVGVVSCVGRDNTTVVRIGYIVLVQQIAVVVVCFQLVAPLKRPNIT